VNDSSDQQLLREYASRRSESAFAEIVRRHIDLVYSAALRLVGGAQAAEDVTQMVFVALARQASQLTRHPALSGWLHCTTRNVAAKTVRSDVRRQVREEEAAVMNELLANDAAAIWEHIAPHLDAALGELSAAERDAVLLRYFEKKSAQEMAQILGVSHEAAQKRVNRAVEKLRDIFAKHGVTAGVGGLATIISINAVQAAPVGLAATIATASILSAGSGAFTIMKIMTITNLKLGASALVVAGAAAALVIQHQTQNKLQDENGLLQQQVAQLRTDNESFSNRLAAAGDNKKLPDNQFNELLKLRGEVGVLRQQTNELGKFQQENRRLQSQIKTTPNPTDLISPEDQIELHRIHTINAMKQLGLAMRIYAGDHNDQYATNFDQLKYELNGVTNFPGNISLNDIEFMNIGLVNETMPDKIMFRQRNPDKMISGAWMRVYGLGDGSVQMQYSNDGNFDAYEQQHMVSPSNQNQ